MKFNSAKEMYDCLESGKDLYNTVTNEYVFVYNINGAICVYSIDKRKAKELSKDSKESGDYWGAFLGVGGSVYENGDELEYCKEKWNIDGWIKTDDYVGMITEADCFSTGGGFYLSVVPMTFDGKDAVLVIDNEFMYQYVIYENISDDIDEIMNDDSGVLSQSHIGNSIKMTEETKVAYLKAVKMLLDTIG